MAFSPALVYYEQDVNAYVVVTGVAESVHCLSSICAILSALVHCEQDVNAYVEEGGCTWGHRTIEFSCKKVPSTKAVTHLFVTWSDGNHVREDLPKRPYK